MTACWHVVQTVNGMLADEEISQLKFQTFYPRIRTENEKGRVSFRPYITGYLFVKFDKSLDVWEPIQWARGVRVTPGWPVRVNERELEPLLGLARNSGFIDPVNADRELFKIGDRVEVPVGPWAGFKGPVKTVEAKRLGVLLSIFGRQQEVWVDKNRVISTT